MSAHRDKAVEAAMQSEDVARAVSTIRMAVTEEVLDEAVEDLIRAAESHLERMFFERFKEAVLSKEALQAGADEICVQKPAPEADCNEVRIEFEAALSKAQELMEEGG